MSCSAKSILAPLGALPRLALALLLLRPQAQ
jgi:hypothetical protein